MSAISSVLSLVNGGGRPAAASAFIIPLDIYNNDKPLTGEKRYFQYFPETITDSKQTSYETKTIPGLSHPLYQWVAGGAREISFTAVFSCDISPTQSDIDSLDVYRYFTSATPTTTLSPSDPNNVDIPSAIAWLRQFCYPWYRSSSGLGPLQHPKPPRKLLLNLPNVRLNVSSSGNSDEVCCIMLQCEASYEAFFSNGAPRLAKVQLQFAETIQSQGKVNVQDAFALRNVALGGYKLTQTNQDKKQS